jgi:hypothetical protein
VSIEKPGEQDPAASEPAHDADAFALSYGRLERTVAASCRLHQSWPGRVAAGIYAFLQFADADPDAVRVLTAHSVVRRLDGGGAYVEAVEHFADLFRLDAPQTRRSADTPSTIVRRIARQTSLRIESQVGGKMVEMAPDLIILALTPYVAFADARHWSAWTPYD